MFLEDRSFALHSYVPCQLALISQTVTRSISLILEAQFGISMPEWKVLATIAESPSLCAVAVAKRAQLDTVAVSRAVNKLIDRGLVAREQDGDDRRRSILSLSEYGMKLHAQITPEAKSLEASLLDDLSEEDIRVLITTIASIRAKAQDMEDLCGASNSSSAYRQRVESKNRSASPRRRPPHSVAPFDHRIISSIIPYR